MDYTNFKSEITSDIILEMTPKELIDWCNRTVKELNVTSIHPVEVKEEMLGLIKKGLSGIEVLENYSSDKSMVIKLDRLEIQIKPSTKSTGEIKQITKLRSKYVVKQNGFKISNIDYRVHHPGLTINDFKTLEVVLDPLYDYSDVILNFKAGSLKFKEYISRDVLIEELQKRVYWKDIKKVLNDCAADGFMNEIMTHLESLKGILSPSVYKKLSDIPSVERFVAGKKIVMEINDKKYDEIIDIMFSK